MIRAELLCRTHRLFSWLLPLSSRFAEKCNHHKRIRTEILCRMVRSGNSQLSRRLFSWHFSILQCFECFRCQKNDFTVWFAAKFSAIWSDREIHSSMGFCGPANIPDISLSVWTDLSPIYLPAIKPIYLFIYVVICLEAFSARRSVEQGGWSGISLQSYKSLYQAIDRYISLTFGIYPIHLFAKGQNRYFISSRSLISHRLSTKANR